MGNKKNLDHIAIIMDGNGTWAKRRALPRNMGHRKGAQTLVNIVRDSIKLDIKYLTVFAFSTENWSRPEEEVSYLMKLINEFLNKYKNDLVKDNIRFRVIGSSNRLSEEQINLINEVETMTKDCNGLNFTVAFNYGSYDELLSATKQIACEYKEGKIELDDIDKEFFSNHLYTKELPDVDLLIRTSGQYRISNFMLWQISYSEIYFTKTLWPDFHKKDLQKAIDSYYSRDRRFGGIKE